jgi:hypothetical protein
VPDKPIAAPPGPTPVSYQLGKNEEVAVKAVTAAYDGSGASGSFVPALIIDGLGLTQPIICPAPKVAAGESAVVSWFPGLGADTAAPAAPVYWLPANLLRGGPLGADPDVDLAAVGAVQTRNGTAYFQDPPGVLGAALALNQEQKGATILGNMVAQVLDPTLWGDTDVFSVVLSGSAIDDFAGTGPYVDAGTCVGTGYVSKPDGSMFTPCTLIVPPLDGFGVTLNVAWAYLYDGTGTPIGPTYPFALAAGDMIGATWSTAIGAWD